MTLIEQFLQRYLREYDYYREVARRCSQECESALEQSGIRAIVTHRAKRPARLEQKLAERAKDKNYQSLENICSDIVDLAGVRIALYFPADETEVDKILRDRFIVDKHKTFTETTNHPSIYKQRFPGYCAQHYLVQLGPDSIPQTDQRYGSARVEIQVASVLMHAWSEVEHDLSYKPLTGSLSVDEYAILDEINGLVIAGEVALGRLQRAVQLRVAGKKKEFANHFELAAYLYDVMSPLLTSEGKEPFMGRIDVLMSFLRSAGMATPGALSKFTGNLEPYVEDRPIAEQIIDRILEAHSDLYAAFDQIRKQVEPTSPYKLFSSRPKRQAAQNYPGAIGHFLSRWIAFEHVVTKLGDLIHPNQPIKWQKLDKTLPYLGFDLSLLEKIENIRSIRNNLLHGRELPETQKLRWAAKTLEKVLSNLQERAQGEAKKIIEASIGRFVAGMNDETISRLRTLRQRGVQLRNQLITPEEFPVWSAEFEKWHSELLTEAERESANLRKWLEPLDKLRKWDVTRWVNNQHRLKLNIISETLDRLAKYLTTNL